MSGRTGPLSKGVTPTTSTTTLVDLLDRSKNRFAPEDRAAKRAALLALADRPLRNPASLLRLHEALCFLRAYADDAELLQLVEDALETFGARVEALRARRSADAAGSLDETGIVRTTIFCPLSYPAARWLAARFPEGAEIDWDDPETEERLGSLLPLLVELAGEVAPVEVGVSYRAWVAAAKGDQTGSDLGWLLDRLERAPIPATARHALYDGLRLRIRWELGETSASRTRARLPAARLFFHRGGLVRWRGSLARRLPGPRIPVRRATASEAEALLDAGRAALAVRYREIHGFNFANRGDVLVADVGRGVEIAWVGLLPDQRLPLRAHYGCLLVKNGVPIGYGVASLLFDGAEIAFNIFPTFRPGESVFVFVRLLAFVHQCFRIRTFHLSRYQIGHHNDEAIESGAFWFYYKLGFRPKRADLRRLAAAERRQIAREPTHRSSRETLERLCQDGMVASARGRPAPGAGAFEAERVGLRAAWPAGRGGGGDAAAIVARRLGLPGWRAWPQAERRAFARMAPILALIPDLPEWSLHERQAVAEIIRAKGGSREADYLRRMQAHRRLRNALLGLGKSGRA